MTRSEILVAFDGSRCAGAALRWAQDEAARRSVPVHLVYVYEWATSTVPVPVGADWPDPAVRHESVAAIDEAVAHARTSRPAVPITGSVLDGTVVPTLRSLSERARLLVVGHRGLGGFDGLLAGSVAVGLATCAHCPVVVHRGSAPPRYPVVVGVDESPDAAHVIDFAFDQAVSRDVDLIAVRAWRPPPLPARADVAAPAYDPEALADAERRVAADILHGWQDKHPQVHLTTRLAPRTAADALVTASTQAQLVVVGSLGRGGSPALPLGSVARALIQHAHCPVAVVRPDAGPPAHHGGAR